MRKIVTLLIATLFIGCFQERGGYSDIREKEHPYPIHDARGKIECYGTFERYMWDEGFPDTIIVEVTRNGVFKGYSKASRYDLLKDSLGNYYSPGYAVKSAVGDMLIYDVKGNFVRYDADIADNPKREITPYNP